MPEEHKKAKPREITRKIKPEVEHELWGRSAGRCAFPACNKQLYKSPVTQERVNIAEKAHIWSFSEDGPRGWGPFKLRPDKLGLNEAGNLMLVCHDCHKLIDADKKGEKYSAELLQQWKAEHEKRVEIVTGIPQGRKSHVVLYCANIGSEALRIDPREAQQALFPDWFPAEERPISLSMTWEGRDDEGSNYWQTQVEDLRKTIFRNVEPRYKDGEIRHTSIFGFAPIPLLIQLGALFTDKPNAQVYQLHREPFQSWKWLKDGEPNIFRVKKPDDCSHKPALVLSLSGTITHDRVTSILGEDTSIWELSIDAPLPDFLRTPQQLEEFRNAIFRLMDAIGVAHGKTTPLHIFPAIPVACAVEMGRVRMPKADMPWVIYDQSKKHQKFVRALTIGGNDE